MIPPYNFYWFRIDNKHITEPWLDQALMDLAYRSEITIRIFFLYDWFFSFTLVFLLTWYQRNWFFATNSNFHIPISLRPDGVNLWYFKLRLFNLLVFIVWNWVAKIKGLKIQCLWQRLNSFDLAKQAAMNVILKSKLILSLKSHP